MQANDLNAAYLAIEDGLVAAPDSPQLFRLKAKVAIAVGLD